MALLDEKGWLGDRTFGSVVQVFTEIGELLESNFQEFVEGRLIKE